MRREIELLFLRLLLGETPDNRRDDDSDLEHAFLRARKVLRADIEHLDSLHFELRLRLALHLSPREAIAYNPRRVETRSELIRRFLEARHGRTSEEAEQLALDVARVLWAWDEKRESVTGYLRELLRRQGSRCANCRVELSEDTSFQVSEKPPITLRCCDAFKPYHHLPVELLSPEVDHIEPVSRFGRNTQDNLQALCRLCNFGKGDRLGMDTRLEAKHSADAVCEIPHSLRAKMLYYVLVRDGRRCTLCGDADGAELTIRKVHSDGGFLRSNLYCVCVGCASWDPVDSSSA